MENVYLKDITHERTNEEVCEWEFFQVPNRDVRIYFKAEKENGLGFLFYAFEKTGHVWNEYTKKDDWHKEYCIGECVVQGNAFFDGIRHLYYGDEKTDNFGYHYYADLEMIADTINALRVLEKKFCRDYDG